MTSPLEARVEQGVRDLERRLHGALESLANRAVGTAVSLAFPDAIQPWPAMRVVRLSRNQSDANFLPARSVLREVSGSAGVVTGWQTLYECGLSAQEVTSFSVMEPRGVPGLAEAASGRLTRSVALIALKCDGAPDKLTVYLAGPQKWAIFAALTRFRRGVFARWDNGPFREATLQMKGLAAEDSLLPGRPQAAPESRLLRELMYLPEKFLFLEWSDLPKSGAVNGALEIAVFLDDGVPPLDQVTPDEFVCNATVAINVEEQTTHIYPLGDQETVEEIQPGPGRAVVSVEAVREYVGGSWCQIQRHTGDSVGKGKWKHWHRSPISGTGGLGGPISEAVVAISSAPGEGTRTVAIDYLCMGWGGASASDSLVSQDGEIDFCGVPGAYAGPLAPVATGLTQWYCYLRTLFASQGQAGTVALRDLLQTDMMKGASVPPLMREAEQRRLEIASAMVESVQEAIIRDARIVLPGVPDCLYGIPDRVLHGREIVLSLDEAALPGGRAELLAIVAAKFFDAHAPLKTFVRLTVRGYNEKEWSWDPFTVI